MPFPIWNQSVGACPVLTIAFWPAYRFLKKQVRLSGIPISLRTFHSLLWSTQPWHWIECEVIPHIQGQRNPSKIVGGAKSHLEANPIPARDAQRVQTYLVRTRTQRTHRGWDRTLFGCLLRMYGSAVACRRGRGSGCSRPGCGLSPLGGGLH